MSNSAKQLLPAAKDALKLSLSPDGPFDAYPPDGAKAANWFSMAKKAYHWVKKAGQWLLKKVELTPKKKKNLKFNASKDRGRPDRLDKDYEPVLNGDENCLDPSPSKRHPKIPLSQKRMHTIS